MWREVATGVFADAVLAGPATVADLEAAEAALGFSLPAQLRELLQEANGIIGRSGTDTVWPVSDISRRNLSFRSDPSFRELYMPFDSLLFFGDNGGGDQFAFVIGPDRPDIFVWEHESDSRNWVANDLADYLRRCLASGGDEWYAR
jgi:hypothetical protein